jgi:2-dehydropantoate 2-reductase
MRIAVMATGAVGGYFGARLAAAGHDVHFIARGANLEAIRTKGLKVDSVIGDLFLPKPSVTDDPAHVGPVDIVLFAVKLWDTEEATRRAAPLIGPDTRVIPLQNGIDSPDRIAAVLGPDAVAPGSAYIATVLSAPGVVSHTSQFARMIVGSSDGKADATLSAFTDAARTAGIDISLSDAIERERWQKFVFLVGLSGATAAMRLPLGPILDDPETRQFFHDLMQEVVTLGHAKGVPIPADFAADRLRFADAAPWTMKASMLHDLERGHRLEVDWLAGYVVRSSRELGLEAPANEAVYKVLKLHRMGTVGARAH